MTAIALLTLALDPSANIETVAQPEHVPTETSASIARAPWEAINARRKSTKSDGNEVMAKVDAEEEAAS